MKSPKREQFTLRLPQPLKEQLEIDAKKMGISLNALIITKLNQQYKH